MVKFFHKYSQQMMGVFATGRKAQNYYHYLSMTNSAYFDMLTTNTQVCTHQYLIIITKKTFHFQRKLMQQKTLICYSLNVALWFFGHNATTALGQVVITIHHRCLFCFLFVLVVQCKRWL